MTTTGANLEAVFELLARYSWTIHTCDAGYRCSIHKSPEHGGDLLGDGVADTIERAIQVAIESMETAAIKQGFKCLRITCASKDAKWLMRIISKAGCNADGWTDGETSTYNIYEKGAEGHEHPDGFW